MTLDVENLLNLIDSEYGRQTKASSSDRSIAEAVPVSLGDGNFTYEYKPAYKMSLGKVDNESYQLLQKFIPHTTRIQIHVLMYS